VNGTLDIRVCGYLAASFLLEREPSTWDLIIILDSGLVETPFIREYSKRHLCLKFDDIVEPAANKCVVAQNDVARALRFARTSDKLIVSCRAGQSRSAALAYLVACQSWGAERALGVLDPTRHIPNRLVVSLGDRLLGDPEVLDRFHEWQSQHRHITLSDHYRDIERELEALIDQGAVNRIE